MGFLDKTSRVVDFVLTERGRKLYAVGRLDFSHFSLLDDGLDYDPYSTGTLTDFERDVQVAALPMWEAPYVRDVRDAQAPLEPQDHLFTAGGGYNTVPFMSSPTDGSSLDLMCDQWQENGSYRRSGSGLVQIDLSLSGETENLNPGFQVRVFSSGANGLAEVYPRRDLSGRRSFDPFLSAVVDDEIFQDAASVGKPSSQRVASAAAGIDVKGTK